MMHDSPMSSPEPAAANPFRHRLFLVIWVATVVSNIGSWMYSVASGWLMISLDRDPLMVSMVQVANALPMFLFAIPAGALVDIINQRRFLILGELIVTITSSIFAALVMLHAITPMSVLTLSFLVAVGSALTAPAWQTVVSQLVPRAELPAAVAANSVGINVSRAIGPALGGLLVATLGIVVPFWLDAFSNIGVIAALIWWRPRNQKLSTLPVESFGNALRTGLRHARYNPHLRPTLIRCLAFFVFAGAYWALLSLVVSSRLSGGAALYGVLLGTIGAAAVACSFFLRKLRTKLGADRLVAGAMLCTALSMAIFALAHSAILGIIASLIAGASWITAVSSLNISAQVALPDWVRGRGLAIYVTVMFGALTLGSAMWGGLASVTSVPIALLIAAAGITAAVPLSWKSKLQTGANIDFSPSMHWPQPVSVRDVEPDRGPVLVMIEYRIDPSDRDPFLHAIWHFSKERKRDGAYGSGIFEDLAIEGRFVETFLVDSWLDHLRQHQRVTRTDSDLEESVRRFQKGDGPLIRHLVTARPQSR
jgi:predicted MFS family arabinose efflux permease